VTCCRLITPPNKPNPIADWTMSRVALILVEGETEEEFYSLLISKYHNAHPKQVKNLHGNFSINAKIVDESAKFATNHPGVEFDVYVCIDQERFGSPAFNQEACESKLKSYHGFKRLVPAVAVLMCESLFFLDIEGIYKFLRTPRKHRNPAKFQNFRQLTHHDLAQLFKTHGKIYRKGKRCQNFLTNLNLAKMLHAAEIKNLINSLKETAPKAPGK
jgi:hypothetical protein